MLVLAEGSQLWTMKPDGTDQHKLLEEKNGLMSPRWSPSGDAIYYFRVQGGTAELVRFTVSGPSTESAVVASGLQPGDYFTLSADGSHLVYTRAQSYSNLWLAELPAPGATAGVQQKPLTSGTLSYGFLSISPDGRWLTFTISSTTSSNVYKMNVEGGQPVQLTFFDAGWVASPVWSPDGRRIAFICGEGGTPKVWVVGADGGTASPLDKTNLSETNYSVLAWFPSSEIVYLQPGLNNLRRLNVETQEEHPILPADSMGWLISKPIYSPDGKKIAIWWNRPEGRGVWLITLDRYSERLLYPGEYVPFGWSPDEKFIYAAVEDGREIVQFGLGDSKSPAIVSTMPGYVSSGTVSLNGRKIIVSVREGKSDVWLMKDFDPQAGRAR